MVKQFGPLAQNAAERKLLLQSEGPILEIIAKSKKLFAGQNCRGLIDSGASVNCIDNATARKLGLNIIDERYIQSATQKALTPVYIGILEIPDLSVSISGQFYGAELLGTHKSYHYLLGRDFLSDFIFSYNGPDGTYQLAKASDILTVHGFDE